MNCLGKKSWESELVCEFIVNTDGTDHIKKEYLGWLKHIYTKAKLHSSSEQQDGFGLLEEGFESILQNIPNSHWKLLQTISS